jgi:uncharacterized protein with FMN-binding domain
MAKKMSPRLVTLSSSAVAAIYLAGYLATRTADAGIPTSAPSGIVATASVAPTAVPTRLGLAQPVEREVDDRRGRRGRRGEGPGLTAPQPRVDAAGPSSGAPSAVAPTAPGASTTAPGPGVAPSSTPRPVGAAASSAAPPVGTATPAASSGYRDGTYTGSGTSRRGGFEVAVTIQGGRIANVALTRVTTQYPASRIAGLPGQVVARQSAQVDRVSGATYSVQAFQQAVQAALAQAKSA